MTVSNTLYTLNSYTVNTDTDLVPAAPNFTMASFLVVNNSGGVANVTATITDGAGAALAVLLPAIDLADEEIKTLSINSINVPATTHKIMVQASVAGVSFIASGVVIT